MPRIFKTKEIFSKISRTTCESSFKREFISMSWLKKSVNLVETSTLWLLKSELQIKVSFK